MTPEGAARVPGDASAAPGAVADHALAAGERRLLDLLATFDSVIVAFSGGVDSAYLALAATRVLGAGALCVTADSPSYPDHHRQLALRIARECSLHHDIIHTAELDRPEYRANPVNRCYYCKHELYTTLTELTHDRGFSVIIDGSNADDRGDYRPGRKAAREFGVRSPLDEAGLTKADIRELSRLAGLPTWDEPASACLSSRIPYESEVTDDKLRMIERAEDVLRGLGFRVCRVRHHDTLSTGRALPGSQSAGQPLPSSLSGEPRFTATVPAARTPSGALARIEIGRDEMARALEPAVRDEIVRELKALGYQHVTIDLQGYRMGSLNEGVRLRPA